MSGVDSKGSVFGFWGPFLTLRGPSLTSRDPLCVLNVSDVAFTRLQMILVRGSSLLMFFANFSKCTVCLYYRTAFVGPVFNSFVCEIL